MAGDDIVYALHQFDAENEDELSFSAGEAIVVLERDDQYGDGWFQGRNTAGDVGLFPQSYTSVDPPSDSPLASPTSFTPHESLPIVEPISSLPSAVSDLQSTLEQLKVEAQQTITTTTTNSNSNSDFTTPIIITTTTSPSLNGDTSSIKSRSSQISREEDDLLPMNSNPRAVLAAKAAANAEKDASNERAREKAERERVYELSRDDIAGVVDGLQLSEESEEEEEVRGGLLPHVIHSNGDNINNNSNVEHRPRVNSSTSATSVYDLEENKTSTRPTTPPPQTRSYTPPPLPPAIPVTSTPPTSSEPSTPPLPTSARHFALDTFVPTPVELVAVMGGLAAVGATTAAYLHSSREPSPRTIEQPTFVSPSPVQSTANIPPPILLPSNVNNSNNVKAVNTPPPTLVSHFLNSQPSQTFVSSPVNSLGSMAAQSRSSSRQDSNSNNNYPTSAGTSDTSLRDSYGNGTSVSRSANNTSNNLNLSGNGKVLNNLPADPTTWGVREVVEWGKMKGFDTLTLSKFEEHEISGDILLEMDVTMLKEIDLSAFGRRVHIYNAIKELKLQAARATSLVVPPSPAQSGYEPDSPGVSPYGSQPFYTPAPYTIEQEERSTRRGSDSLNTNIHGLGFNDDGSRPPSAGSSIGLGGIRKQNQNQNQSSIGHRRAATNDSLNTINNLDGNVDTLIREEREDSDAPLPVRSSSGMSFRRPSKATNSGGESRKGSLSDTSETGSVSTSKIKKTKSDRSFFGAALGRSRKAPPKDPTSALADSRASISSNKRGTRLFHPFAPSSSSSKSLAPPRKTSASSIINSPRDGPSSMTEIAVGRVTSEMELNQPDQVTSGNLVDKLGEADYKGWMRKKGESYNTWKQRFFFLKGTHLYYLKSENETKAKGFINLSGYRVLVDPDIHPGEFAFKIVHETEKTHYFSASDQVTIRNWMKSIMKATIGRDYSAPVVSSCNVETMSLAAAQSMNPKPRPPSPESRARAQKERYAGSNPNTLTPKDAAILMEFSAPTPSKRSSGRASTIFTPVATRPISIKPGLSTSSIPLVTSPQIQLNDPIELLSTTKELSPKEDLLAWVNLHVPCQDFNNSLRSGEVLVRLLEKLSGTDSGLEREVFEKYRPAGEDKNFFISEYFDTVFAVFDYISPKVSTDNISMDDMLSGNESQMILFVERFRKTYP